MGNEQLLTLRLHRKEAADNGASARRRTALTRPRIAVESVQSVVDRDLRVVLDGSPGEHFHAVAHRVRLAGMVEVAARCSEHGEAIEAEFAQVHAFPLAHVAEFVGRQDPAVSTPEDELAFSEAPAGVHAAALRASVAHLDVIDHSTQPTL